MQVDLERRVKEEAEEQALQDKEAHEKAVRDFEMLQMGLEIRNSRRGVAQTVVAREGGKLVVEEEVPEQKGTKRKFELDEEELRRLASEETQRAKTALSAEKVLHPPSITREHTANTAQDAASKTKLPSFWVPSLTPSVADSELIRKPPKLTPVCPASEKDHIHHYSLKSLTTVHFTEEEDERTKHGDAQRICPACKKGLSNSIKAMRLSPPSPLCPLAPPAR